MSTRLRLHVAGNMTSRETQHTAMAKGTRKSDKKAADGFEWEWSGEVSGGQAAVLLAGAVLPWAYGVGSGLLAPGKRASQAS